MIELFATRKTKKNMFSYQNFQADTKSQFTTKRSSQIKKHGQNHIMKLTMFVVEIHETISTKQFFQIDDQCCNRQKYGKCKLVKTNKNMNYLVSNYQKAKCFFENVLPKEIKQNHRSDE